MQDQARRGSNGLSRSSSWIFNVWSVGRGFVSVQGERFEPVGADRLIEAIIAGASNRHG